MVLDLDMIQKMWKQDSKIDLDNLHTESINIPKLQRHFTFHGSSVGFRVC